MSVRAHWVFHNVATEAGNGDEYKIANVGSNTILVLALQTIPTVESTPVTYTIHFEAKGLIGDYVSIPVWDETKMDLVLSATETSGKLFTIDLTGKSSFRVNLVSIDGGSLSVQGKVIE